MLFAALELTYVYLLLTWSFLLIECGFTLMLSFMKVYISGSDLPLEMKAT